MITDLYPEVLATALLFLGLWLLSPLLDWTRGWLRMLLVLFFAAMNARYLIWRFQSTMTPLTLDPQALWYWIFAGLELVTSISLTWHFFVLVKPSDRTAEADAAQAALATTPKPPGVDVFIPTHNEPEDVLKRTIRAAQALDYPDFEVWVLDDGNRSWLRDYCEAHSVSYLVRPDRRGFKAGNLNHALAKTVRPVIAVVDADFALDPRFLSRTVGLLADPGIGIVQTPQHFTNPDAIQYNLGGERAWPEGQCMFSEVLQSGRDTWDNAFCYGTCFVAKRACLDQVGGFPEATICEDIHTSYVLLSQGHKTRFLNETLGHGLATQDIVEFVRQRTRWCIGTLQCLFAEGGVLRAKRISLLDRLFFLDPVLHHFGALWTFCLLISPALYWWFGLVPFKTDFGHLLVVFAPRMLLTVFGLYWLSGRRTIPFVSELSRAVGIFHIVPAIFRVFANPFRQTFSTTRKTSGSTETEIRWSLMRPHLLLLAITLGGMLYQAIIGQGVGLFMRENVGLMISLTLYVTWLLFFCCLLCVQRPIPGGMLRSVPGARVGSMRRTAGSLLGGILQWK